jgi:DNA polymerase elongation subunit (family B)
MYSISQLKKTLVLDIETTSNYENYEDFCANHPGEIKFWARKAAVCRKDFAELADKTDGEIYKQYAAVYPEFGRIVCISIGQTKFDDDDNPTFLKKSFYGADERKNVEDFIEFMRAVFNKIPDVKILGHDIKRFDMPYILKKCMVMGIKVPSKFHLHDMKPWENCLLDTIEIWKCGSWGAGVSLEHLTFMLGISNPKEADVSSNEDYGGIARAYWNGMMEELKDYCEEDIRATMNVLLKFSHQQTI